MSTIKEDIDFLTSIDRFPKRTQTPVKYPRYQITSDEYNTLVGALQKVHLSGAGQTLSGFKVAESVDDLPHSPSTIGYLVDEILYVYVGDGGDTLGGLYQNVGRLQGVKGDKGDPFRFSDFTPEQIDILKKPATDAAALANDAAAKANEAAGKAAIAASEAKESAVKADTAASSATESARLADENAVKAQLEAERSSASARNAEIYLQEVKDSLRSIIGSGDLPESTIAKVLENAASIALINEQLDRIPAPVYMSQSEFDRLTNYGMNLEPIMDIEDLRVYEDEVEQSAGSVISADGVLQLDGVISSSGELMLTSVISQDGVLTL